MGGPLQTTFDVLSRLATLATLGGLYVSTRSLEKQHKADKDSNKRNVSESPVDSFINDRLLQKFVDTYGGVFNESDPWRRAINSSYRLMEDKLFNERLIQGFLRGTSSISEVTSARSVVLLHTFRDLWRG